MRIRATKASGSFSCGKPGSFELLVHMEADSQVASYREANFEGVLPPEKARALCHLPAYLLRHSLGHFLVTARSPGTRRNEAFYKAWLEADAALARRGIWLLSTTPAHLRREPKWSRALAIARCADADLDPNDQERVVEFLSRVGAASIRECAKRCQASADSIEALYRLVSAGVLFLDSGNAPLPTANLSLEPPPSNPRSDPIGWLEPLHYDRRRRFEANELG